jgi:hypothetical protein
MHQARRDLDEGLGSRRRDLECADFGRQHVVRADALARTAHRLELRGVLEGVDEPGLDQLRQPIGPLRAAEVAHGSGCVLDENPIGLEGLNGGGLGNHDLPARRAAEAWPRPGRRQVEGGDGRAAAAGACRGAQ